MQNTEKKTQRYTAFGSKCFNLRLFLEAVKRLRVIGIAVAILAVTASILVPTITWISDNNDYERQLAYYFEYLNSKEKWETTDDSVEKGIDINYDYYDPDYVEEPKIVAREVNYYALCFALLLIPFTAPFFCLVLFSFLHKRKQSDFYHAIPYTRTCVYVSFVSAALAFVFAISIVSALCSGLIYAASPFSTFAFGDLLEMLVSSMLSSALLASFMMLALSVTGTGATTMLLFALFTCITRAVLGLFSLCVDEFMLVHTRYYPFLSLSWFLPIRIFATNESYYSPLPAYSVLLPYTLIVTLALFALAGLLYKFRRSEMAERSAPNRLMQSIFRCLFTLPFALLLAAMLVIGETDFEVVVILLVVILLVFYLYELITTKRPKNMLKASPWLGAVAGGMVVFALSFVVFGAVVHREIPPEKIESVTVEVDARNSFESLITSKIVTEDERMVELVSTALKHTIRYEKYGFPNGGNGRLCPHDVVIRQTNGLSAKRYLYFTESEEALLKTYLTESTEYGDSYLMLPEYDMLDSINVYTEGLDHYKNLYWDTGKGAAEEFWQIFISEYETLSKDEKRALKDGSDEIMMSKPDYTKPSQGFIEYPGYSNFYLSISISGKLDGREFYSNYVIPPSMEKTLSHLLHRMAEQDFSEYRNEDHLDDDGKVLVMDSDRYTPEEIAAVLFDDLKTGNYTFDEGTVNFACYNDLMIAVHSPKQEEDLKNFFALLADHAREDREATAETLPVVVTVDLSAYGGNVYADYGAYANLQCVLHLTKAEYDALLTSVYLTPTK
ncbi:MAG: hypothetical protein J6B77_09965 [Clostridia bacterium]|nr:hypothetical protein [Clostridia bacterium]